MSYMREAHDQRTICEVLREANDLCQRPEDVKMRVLLGEAQEMAKRMARKLFEYNKNFDKDWWKRNPDKAKDLERRLLSSYLSE